MQGWERYEFRSVRDALDFEMVKQYRQMKILWLFGDVSWMNDYQFDCLYTMTRYMHRALRHLLNWRQGDRHD